MLPEYTFHVKQRLVGRLAGILSDSEVKAALVKTQGKLVLGENAIFIKNLGSRKVIAGNDGSISRGDRVLIVVKIHYPGDSGRVLTAELRDSRQPAAKRWAKVIDLS